MVEDEDPVRPTQPRSGMLARRSRSGRLNPTLSANKSGAHLAGNRDKSLRGFLVLRDHATGKPKYSRHTYMPRRAAMPDLLKFCKRLYKRFDYEASSSR